MAECLYFDTRPLDHIESFLFIFVPLILLIHFTYYIFSLLTRFYFLSVYKPYAEYFLLIPNDAVDRRKLRFSKILTSIFALV